jgi:hypothetical protein
MRGIAGIYALVPAFPVPHLPRGISSPTPMRSLPFIALTFALVTSGCASKSTTGREGTSRDRNVLTQADFTAATSDRSLYDAISRLRATWLVRRGSTSLGITAEGDVQVYMDNVKLGGPESLRSVRVEDIALVRFLSASDATTRFGTNHMHGAIMVESRKR